jgi:hypothetical protein
MGIHLNILIAAKIVSRDDRRDDDGEDDVVASPQLK